MKEELVGLSSLKILYTHIHRQKEEEKKNKTNKNHSTQDSRVVPHRGTN